MKRLYIFILAAALIAASCNKEDEQQLEQLRQELAALEQEDLPSVPGAQQPEGPGDESFFMTFDKARYGVDAAGSVSIAYSLQEAATVEVTAKEGWKAVVNATGATTGTIVVTAPDPASPCDIVAVATAQDGRKTAVTLPVMVRDPYTDATRTDVAAMGYYCLFNEVATDYHFKMMADCGMNMLTIESVDNWKEQLDLAYKYGMKGVLFVNGPAGDYYRNHEDTKLTEIIEVSKNHPALAGYQIYDEPHMDAIPQIVVEKNRIEELDPAHPVYVNLHPSSASVHSLGTEDYFEYVETFVTECNLKFITFDQYPVYDYGIDPSWPRSLEAIYQSSKKHDLQFWAFTLCCREHSRELPSVENIRLQCNVNLLFGAQVNQFFVYRNTSGTNYAPLLCTWENGQLKTEYTQAYYDCQTYCREMHNRGYVFSNCNVKKVCNNKILIGWNENLNQADLQPYLKSLQTSDVALISFIENEGNEYIAVVNYNWKAVNTITAEFADMVYTIDHDGVFTEHPAGTSASFDVEGGDMLVFKVK